ncbi:MAG: alpha/beta fold hydrolase [Bacteroides sp.]|jgi:pimeloyl-ACP methyl ester carboxylesterase|nr:alpha/beta fold hydrolase [Bacteroides sp.]
MNLHYKEIGSGKPLVILHGLFGMSDNFISIASELGKEYHVFIADQRNHGRSGHSPVFSYEAMSDDLLEFLDQQEIEKAHLLGHSMGGKTVMQFAFDHPERVDRLIVADISPAARTSNDQHQNLIDIMLSLDLSGYDSRVQVANALEDKVPSYRLRQFLLKNLYWKDRSSLGWRLNLEVIRDNLDEVFREINPSGSFEKPTLFLRGEKSDYIREQDVDLIRKMFPNAVFETISDGTHWLHADNPDDFMEAIRQFLKSSF